MLNLLFFSLTKLQIDTGADEILSRLSSTLSSCAYDCQGAIYDYFCVNFEIRVSRERDFLAISTGHQWL